MRTGLGVFLLFLSVLPPALLSVDGRSMVAVARALVTRHDVTVPPALGIRGQDRLYYSKWYPLPSLLAVPFVAAGHEIGDLLHLPADLTDNIEEMAALILSALVAGLTASGMILLSKRIKCTIVDGYITALCFTFGTVALVYARTFFPDLLLALLSVACLYFLFGGRRRDVLAASIFASLAILAKPTGGVLFLGVVIYLYRKKKMPWVVMPLASGFVALAILGAYNFIRFGNLLDFGERAGFGTSALLEALAGFILSPGRGVLWYSPVIFALFGLRKRRLPLLEAGIMLLVSTGYLVIYSLRPLDWYGGWSWGPRFLLPVLAILLPLAGFLEIRWKRVLIGLAVVGFLVNAPTLVSFYEEYYENTVLQGKTVEETIWNLSDAPFLKIWGIAYTQARVALGTNVQTLVTSDETGPAAQGRQAKVFRIVALWWWLLPVIHVPRWVGALISAVLATTGILLLRNAYRISKEAENVHLTSSFS